MAIFKVAGYMYRITKWHRFLFKYKVGRKYLRTFRHSAFVLLDGEEIAKAFREGLKGMEDIRK